VSENKKFHKEKFPPVGIFWGTREVPFVGIELECACPANRRE